MKNSFPFVLTIVFSSICFLGFASRKWISPTLIKFDTIDTSIAEGQCLITGTVFFEGKALNDVTVFSKELKITSTDRKGAFSIQVNTSEKYVAFHLAQPYFKTIYFDNYTFKSQHHIHLHVFMRKIDEKIMIIEDKPVIYCYAEKPTSFDLTINPATNFFSFVYPEMNKNNTWSMRINKEGKIEDRDNRTYPYLFWESKTDELHYSHSETTIEGTLVAKKEVVEFLENSLSKLGLNHTEKTDFITYWAPKMIEHNYVFVQLLVDKAYDRIATINIQPKPDNLKRVYLLFSGFMEIPRYLHPVRQNLTSFERNGFTIVEWGGSELPREELFNVL